MIYSYAIGPVKRDRLVQIHLVTPFSTSSKPVLWN
jgi:hypothetical protein